VSHWKYANVTATLALVLSLGGTSWAVSQLPRNSVGPSQLKSNSVTGSKVRNGSLTAKDFNAAEQLGIRGPRGSEGPAGASGTRGPSDGYVDSAPRVPLPGGANIPATVASLQDLPAGSYLFASTATAVDFNNPGEVVTCWIRVNGVTVSSSGVVVGNGPGSSRALGVNTSGGVKVDNPFRATLECASDQNLGAPPLIDNGRLTAIRVETLRLTPTAP
jgi:hypothetical protein